MPVDLASLEILRVFRSPRGWSFVPIHWSHDPEKGDAWIATEMAKYQNEADALRELDIDFGSHTGALVYPGYRRSIHVVDDLACEPRLPLVLFCDFNASPMAWGVGQVVGGWIHVLEDIYRDPSTIEDSVKEFRDSYPNHRAGLHIYGDASVKTFYDTIRLNLRGYPSPLTFHIPEKNPPVKDRTNAVGIKLSVKDGFPGVKINGPKCPHLIEDFEGVVWRPNGKDILKVSDRKDPYFKLTHTSDAFGYWVVREWPAKQEVSRRIDSQKPREPLVPTKVLGELTYKNK